MTERNPESANALTLDLIQKAKDVLFKEPEELSSEDTIGDPSDPMTDFERGMRAVWHMNGGRGNPPKLVLGSSQHDYFIAQGCPSHLLCLNKPLPVSPVPMQPKDWYRKHG